MPGMYAEGDYDLAGFSLGAVERGAVLPRLGEQRAGDVIIGLASSGPHSNGYSLVRRIVERSGLDWSAASPFSDDETLASALMRPTRIYVRQVLPQIRAGRVSACAHITGGGLIENPPRVIAEGLTARFDWNAWTPAPVFNWLQATGGVSDTEMRRTFNCGVGMIVVAEAARAAEVEVALQAAGESPVRMGEVVAFSGDEERVAYRGHLAL
jgi:phosphoribosylaminoimidazole synthetase